MGKISLEIKNNIETIACDPVFLHRILGDKASTEDGVKFRSRKLSER